MEENTGENSEIGSRANNQSARRDQRETTRDERTSPLQQAVGELEAAVTRLAKDAGSHATHHALRAIEHATINLNRIERRRQRREQRRAERDERRAERRSYGAVGDQYYGRSRTYEDDHFTDVGGSVEAESGGTHRSWRYRSRPRSRLYRDPSSARIAGVCAGLAAHFGVENWVIRCIAVTGMIFMPQIVFPGYWILYFIMDRKPPREWQVPPPAPAGDARSPPTAESSRANDAPPPPPWRQPIAGLHRGAASADRLAWLRGTFNQAEERLRKMEGYVTSSRFELDRELQRMTNSTGQ